MSESFNTVLKIFTSPIGIIFIILVIMSALFYKQIVGWFGEYWTKEALRNLPKNKYKILNNIFIKVKDYTSQIDHIVVSPYGIFVIETKQYNGYITGGKYDKNWVRYAGKNKYYYTNPIRQNYGHVKSLAKLLHTDESKLINIVCIPSNAKLKIEHDGELVRNYNIVDKILSYNNIVIDNVDEIVDIINSSNIKDKKIKKEHIKNIKTNLVDKDMNKCPKCGGDLVKRNGKYGEFFGCSNYPKCRYTSK